MTICSRSLCWAGVFVAVAWANRLGVITDANATTMFAILPALWIATGGLGRCALPQTEAGPA